MPTRNDIKATLHGMGGWSRPKDHQNKTKKLLSVFGVMYVIIKSQKDKGKALKKHILRDIAPRGFDARIEKIQGKHQQAITGRDNQIKSLGFTNEKHQQKILRLNKEINDVIAERHVAAVDVLTTCCVSSNRIAERFSYITLFDVSTDSLKNISDGLNFVTQEWRCLSNVMIQMPFTYGTGSSKK